MSDITSLNDNILENLMNPSITLDSVSSSGSKSSSGWTPALMNYPSNEHVIRNSDSENPPWYYSTRASAPVFEFFEGGHPERPEEKIPVNFYDGRSTLSPNQLAGYIMYVQTAPGIKSWNDQEKRYDITCQVIGHSPAGAPEDAPYMKVLPPIPFSRMFDPSQRGNQKLYTPNSIVEELGLVGSRGETCASCIRNGRAFKDTGEVYPSGDPNYKVCEPKGYFYMVVTALIEATKNKKADGVEWDITRFELGKEDSPTYTRNGKDIVHPFICVIDLTANSLNGAYVKDQPDITINGPRQYLAKISRDLNTNNSLPVGDPRRELGYYPVRISTRRKIKANGSPSPFPQLHMDVDIDTNEDVNKQIQDREEEKIRSIELWKTNSPELKVESLPPSAYSGYKGETNNNAKVPTEATAEVVDLDDSNGGQFEFEL